MEPVREAAMSAAAVRIVVAEDHGLVRQGIVAILGLNADLEVVAEAGDGLEAVAACLRLRPDVAVIDLQMPKLSAPQVIQEVRRQGGTNRFLVLSNYGGDFDIRAALDAGASGYLLKECTAEELARAVRTVHGGGRFLGSQVTSSLAAAPVPNPLTAREQEVLALICSGLSNEMIGRELGISDVTVKSHVNRLLSKLGVRDRTQAVVTALRRGLAHLPGIR